MSPYGENNSYNFTVVAVGLQGNGLPERQGNRLRIETNIIGVLLIEHTKFPLKRENYRYSSP